MNYPELYQFAASLAPITDSEWQEFSQKFTLLTVDKGEILMKPGGDANAFYIVLKGILRNYDLDENGKEFTKVFRSAGGFVGPYSEILSKTPVRFFIQAVTSSTLLRFNYSDFEGMMDKYKSWEKLGRRLAEINFLEKENREWELMHLNADKRYLRFLEKHGALAAEIPQYQIASLLAISPEAFNRLIKKMKP